MDHNDAYDGVNAPRRIQARGGPGKWNRSRWERMMSVGMAWSWGVLLAPAMAWIAPARAAEANRACALVTVEEFEAATGLNVASVVPSGSAGSGREMCLGFGADKRVVFTLRIAKRTGPAGREEKGIEAVKKMGGQAEVKTFGPISCSTLMIPTGAAGQSHYSTTCTVMKGDTVAGIDIMAKSQSEMVPMDKVRPLAEKIASRF